MTRTHKILTIALLAAPLAAAASPKQPPPDPAVSKELLDLRSKLMSTKRAEVKKDLNRFRALCDADGYPLVGNIANKSGPYQPSELCADIRKTTPKS